MDPYTYTHLGQPTSFRLLKVLPGEFAKPLRCSLVECALDSKVQYEALSYTWGDPRDRGSITCDGREILATKPCLDAIQHLRLRLQPRLLWIDAVCINQESLPERSQQVKLMGKIYHQAAKVLVWLGCKDGNTPTAFELLSRLRAVKLKHELLLLSDMMSAAFFPSRAKTETHTSSREVQHQR
jgi:Heterokaryon incompatibility protein (HET)